MYNSTDGPKDIKALGGTPKSWITCLAQYLPDVEYTLFASRSSLFRWQ